ncbi:MAG: carboxymuconolactone decarboxylase family protein [Gammaproteobacteria bacterium]|nr:MAG: carboxymuconolactone decarboxylase family protein [Gammaproteobacteria bacterium]TDJ37655.1 MAG: carboxymuconolactone decarboxylase family protein [Gammaproteobacteria bacterium]
MAHVPPRSLEEMPELAPLFEGPRAAMGFVPNSMLTMAHMPQLTIAFNLMVNVAFGGDLKPMIEALAPLVPEQDDAGENLAPELVQLISFAASLAAGCRYCQAHTSHNLERFGGDAQKIARILDYETDPAYSAGERAAVALAFAAARVPNESEAAHFERLREHFSERQIVQIVAIISMFGFLNRWNDTMATELEAPAVAYAEGSLEHIDWTVGKHGGAA